MFPEVVKSGKTQAPTKLGSGVDRAVVTTGKVVADDDDARCANKMDPSMRVLLKRTENMVEEARKATRKTKSKKKGKTPIVIQNDNVEGVQETVNTGYGPIDTIHEAEEEEHDYDITDEWEQSAAGGGSSSTTSRAATARTTTRPSSRQLHSSSSTRGAKSPSGRSNSPHSRAPSAQGRDRPHSRAASTGSPKRPPSRSTVTELFAMSPEDVVQQQKLLTDMGWTQQRVHEGEKEVARGASRSKAKRKDEEEGGEEAEAEGAVGAHTTLEWQNELARHILSMYATTTAAQHMPESRAILEFVDTKRSGSVNITSHELFPGGGGAGEVSFESLVQEEIVATKLARASSKARLLGLKPKDSTIPVESRATTVDTSAVVATTDSENFSKLETLQPHKHSKAPKFPTKGGEGVHPKAIQSSGANRVPLPGDVTMLRGHDGEPVPARPMGPPKCFPVWFVGTGDVYSDWSALSVSKVIDGVKLQAQLQVMSENREFWKYLGVVEAIINRYYKVVLERETQLVEERKLLASVEAQAAFAQSMESRSPSPQRGRSSSRSPSRSPRRSPSRSPSRSPVRTATEDRPTTTTSSQSPSHSRSQSRSQSQSQSQSQSRAQSVMGHSRSASPDWAPLPSSKMLSRKSFAEINTEDWGAGTGSEFFSADQPLSQEATGILGADAPSVVTVDPNPTLKDRVNIGVFWLQLVSTGVAMVTLSVEDKKYDLAMNMLQRLERWSTREDLLTHKQRLIARACTLDAFAYYFFRRRKLFASLRHTKLAAALHEKLRNNDGIAAGLLQVAVVECFQAKFKECHKTIYQFLAMIEDGRLAFQTATPRQLCLVAVGYHNLAVVQLKMQHSDLAAKSSQNARKIARLCLSTSTRFLATFQMTHDAASKDMGFHIKHRPGAAGYGGELENAGDSTLGVLNRMTEDFFKTVPDMVSDNFSSAPIVRETAGRHSDRHTGRQLTRQLVHNDCTRRLYTLQCKTVHGDSAR